MKHLLITQFDLHHRLFNNVLEGFSDKETNQRLHGNKQINHVKYLAGHLLNSNYGLAEMAGMRSEIKWHKLFAVMGQSEAKDDFPYPTIKEIKAEWNQLYPPLRFRLGNMETEALNNKPPAPFDQVADSSGELWSFVNHYVAYHLGQIGLLRRGFGKRPMGYN